MYMGDFRPKYGFKSPILYDQDKEEINEKKKCVG